MQESITCLSTIVNMTTVVTRYGPVNAHLIPGPNISTKHTKHGESDFSTTFFISE